MAHPLLPSEFTLARYRLTLEALEPLHLPPFKGSALRGGFGHTFKRLACAEPWPCGQRCERGNACPYGYIFETSPPADSEALRTIREVARPFVIQPPHDPRTEIPAGERLTFGLVLIGQGINYLPYFIAAFHELGKIGLGRTRGKYRLLAVDAVSTPSPTLSAQWSPAQGKASLKRSGRDPLPGGGSDTLSPNPSPSQGEGSTPSPSEGVPSAPSSVLRPSSLSWSTPSPSEGVPSAALSGGSAQGRGGGLPIYRAEDETIRAVNASIGADAILERAAALSPERVTLEFLTPTRLKYQGRWAKEGPPFHVLLRRLLDRVSSLSYFHCGQQFEADFRGLIERAAGVRIARAQTRWEDWSRFSGRQKQRVEMGGLAGQVTYAGDLRDYLPLLALGEWVHAGKGTVFGNGRYGVGSKESGVRE